MRKLLLAFALLLAGSGVAFADGQNSVVSATTVNPRWTVTVFNDQGSALTSGTIVKWDEDDTDFSSTLYPYVITSTTADDPYTAGVMLTDSCANQSLCEIVVYGPVRVLLADATDAVTVDTLIGTSTVAAEAGDYATGANTCALGTLIAEDTAAGSDHELGTVFVDVDCD